MRILENGLIESNGKLISIKRKPIKPISALPIQVNEAKKHSAFGCNNPSRLPYVYTPLELNALNLFNGFIEDRKVYHEYKIQAKDELGMQHTYWLDYFDAVTKTCIEISPKFHKTFKSVLSRDKKRAKLLMKKYGIETIHVSGKSEKEIKTLIKYLEYKGISKETLDFWFKVKAN